METGILVSGPRYRTAISLEKRGLGTVQYQGPSRGWFKANYIIWNPDTDSMEIYYAAKHVHGTTGACLKNPGGQACTAK